MTPICGIRFATGFNESNYPAFTKVIACFIIPKSCNHLVFASKYRHIGCVGFTIFMLSVAQLRLR
jgi:hypothetical protein